MTLVLSFSFMHLLHLLALYVYHPTWGVYGKIAKLNSPPNVYDYGGMPCMSLDGLLACLLL